MNGLNDYKHMGYNSQEEISTKDSLAVHLGNLLKSGKMADVTIEVNGKLFLAHKIILKARSPVFRAELFGSANELKWQHIRINNMDTEVFKYLLQYIYTDTIDGNLEISSTNLAQQLLVAADRYRLEGLKIKCEKKLSTDVSLDSVLFYLALAEQCSCSKLKEACFKFIAERKIL